MTAARMLVVAKAPVAGRVKTRLGADVGAGTAADLAAAALLDTLAACREAVGARRCTLALAGDLDDAARGAELRALLDGWHVFPQRGDGLADRLAHAHAAVPRGPGPVVQVGMDTPQVTPATLTAAADATAGHDAALGPAEDGGWWVLALRRPSAAGCLRGVPMSTATTHRDTLAAMHRAGLRVAGLPALRDVDTTADAEAVALAAPATRFADAWARRRTPAAVRR